MNDAPCLALSKPSHLARAADRVHHHGGLEVINRASHLSDPGSTLASGRMWAEFQSISTWLRGFFSGYSGFPPSSKSIPIQLHLTGFAVLRDHTWIVWRQPWAPSHAFGPIPLSRLILKSPCREWSTKRTFTFTSTVATERTYQPLDFDLEEDHIHDDFLRADVHVRDRRQTTAPSPQESQRLIHRRDLQTFIPSPS